MGKNLERFIRMDSADGPLWGATKGQRVFEIHGDPFGEWELGAEVGTVKEKKLLAPTLPTKLVCVGLNYPTHADESSMALPEEPLIFFKPPSSVIGPGTPILLPPQSERVDYEAELAVVIGRRCRGVSPQEAWNCVLGVTCANDVTARDLQQRDHQWTRAKGFDTFSPLGPWLVTGLSESEVADLEVICRVNGEVRQRGRMGEMVFSPPQLIAYIASIMTLEPGDVVMTGTPAGVGPLAAGDAVEVEVEGIGVLRNPVALAT
jgi:2-keto-4-pentenoate hydratase/2-oxohepta-3-ene-1,7-dioic acid hydratase in catechol pathway